MSKIKSIHINNFKFFRNNPPIELDGKHLLLYGENGSGKSSVYYGLYTLLQATSKQVDEEQKYFTIGDHESLVNIYAETVNGSENTGAFISVTDTGNRSYKISYTETGCMADPNLLESNRASDFVNYVSLFRFQLFRNSEPVNLHKVFKYTIIPHMSFPAFVFKGKTLRGAEEMYKAYKEGPGYTRNAQGKDILVYKYSPEYRNFLELEAHFNDRMQDLINFINANIYDKIKAFDYDFKAELSYDPETHDKKDTWIDYNHPFGIYLRITEYNGTPVNIEHPNTFLNEAKMTALAFCIRWAILDYRLQAAEVPEAMKVLVLDDIMISLDMANRNKLIRIITRKLVSEYQILFLTHDRQIYDYMKKELIRIYNLRDENALTTTPWQVYEMYEAEHDGMHEPIVQPMQSEYERALRFFRGDGCFVDNIASGNAIRQAIEGAFKDLFHKANIVKNANGTPIDFNSLLISSCIEIARNNLAQLGLTDDFMDRVDALRDCLLNPASHDNPGRNFYRQELKEAFEVYQTLCKCDHRIIVPNGETVTFSITPTDNVTHNYAVVLGDNLQACRLIDKPDFHICWQQSEFHISDSEDPRTNNIRVSNHTLQQLYRGTFDRYLQNGTFDVANIQDVVDAVSYNGQTLREIVNAIV